MTEALIAAALCVVAVVAGGGATMAVFRIIDARAEDRPGSSIDAAATVLRGGAWIGGLERLAIYAGLLAGWPESIAIVLAVKGLGRYPELRVGDRPAVAERFIIGTLVSVLCSCACAGIGHWLMNR